MKLKSILSLCSIVFILNACSKKDEPAAVTKTTLISKSWLLTAATVTPAINGQTNLLAGSTTCDLDDLYVFVSNGNYTLEEGATKCNASDPQIYERGTWRFLNNETQLETTATGSTASVANLTELTATRMVQTAVENISGTNYTVTYTFTAR
jgi:hypothetical protein